MISQKHFKILCLSVGLTVAGMKKLIGFIFIWIAVGMIFMMFLPNLFWGIVFAALLLIAGFQLFKCGC